MRDKIISFVLWILVWFAIVFWYKNFFVQKEEPKDFPQMWWQFTWSWWQFDYSQMTDEQLERMSERSWLSQEELRERMDNGEDIRNFGWNPWNGWQMNWIWKMPDDAQKPAQEILDEQEQNNINQ